MSVDTKRFARLTDAELVGQRAPEADVTARQTAVAAHRVETLLAVTTVVQTALTLVDVYRGISTSERVSVTSSVTKQSSMQGIKCEPCAL